MTGDIVAWIFLDSGVLVAGSLSWRAERGGRGGSGVSDGFGPDVVFAVFAAAVSALSEAVSRYLGLRGEYLLRGIRSLTDGKSDFGLPWPEMMPGSLGRYFVRRRQTAASASAPDAAVASAPPAAMVAQIMSHPLVAASADQASPPDRSGDKADVQRGPAEAAVVPVGPDVRQGTDRHPGNAGRPARYRSCRGRGLLLDQYFRRGSAVTFGI